MLPAQLYGEYRRVQAGSVRCRQGSMLALNRRRPRWKLMFLRRTIGVSSPEGSLVAVVA